MFSGMSSLRAMEKKADAPANTAMQQYLAQKYGGGTAGDEAVPKKKKKKKKKEKGVITKGAVQILDEDVTGFKQGGGDAVAAAEPIDRQDAQEGKWACRAFDVGCSSRLSLLVLRAAHSGNS